MDKFLGILGYLTGVAYLTGVFYIPFRLMELAEKGKATQRQHWWQSGYDTSEIIEDSHIRISFPTIVFGFKFSVLLVIPSFFAKSEYLFGQNAIWISSMTHYIDLLFVSTILLAFSIRIVYKLISKPYPYSDRQVNNLMLLSSIILFQAILYFIHNPIARHSYSRIKDILNYIISFF